MDILLPDGGLTNPVKLPERPLHYHPRVEPREVTCYQCGKPFGRKGLAPAVKVSEGVYKHAWH